MEISKWFFFQRIKEIHKANRKKYNLADIAKEVDLVTMQTLELKSSLERTPWFVENVKADMKKFLL
ncbi:hypothetical protein [Acutalibacter sp. JLR.KK004]|uniref:hypothetical protein n=1 Tax=Acutalibacter sp. JLR.KK004 TaxID=3112622 RepID=UPI002FF15966